MTGPSAETLARQALASDPLRSAWVSANAGSGKTYVLVQRVVRLLLAGADPSRILCLTFTKAAAANMQNRVVERLRGWATMPDAKLADEIAALDGRPPDARRLGEARKLFAKALETPGGLKIYTIHAFCGRLLHQFPFEANVAAGFSELDDRDQAELIAQARGAVLAQAAARPESPVGRALALLVATHAEQTIDGALREMIDERDGLRTLIVSPGIDDVDGVVRTLRDKLGLAPHETHAAIEAEILAGGVPPSEWPGLAATLRTGSPTDVRLGDAFAAAAAARDEAGRRAAYLGVFLTGTGKLRAARSFVTAATRKAHPSLAAALDAEMARLAGVLPRLGAAAIVERTAALLTLADATIAAYAAAKNARGLLDYDDLIGRTRTLLMRADAAWVLFKLDGGLDHILVDEAQDTSPAQWEIVRRLTEEFLSGAGAQPRARTVFAVGDEKQSIFSFQGAEPAAFGATRRAYDTAHRAVEKAFDDVRLIESFRSTEAVLAGVDAVFAREEAHRGLSSDEAARTIHETTRRGEAGSVELWPPVAAEKAAHAEEAWDAPFDRVNPQSAVVRLAARIADEVLRAHARDGWSYGEVLILVRQRKALFEAILRALKARGVPVAGADRLIVGQHIAVMDLVALAAAIVTPDDDLALACALKSPLFGLDDDDLMAVAPQREGRLIDALAAGTPRTVAAHAAFRAHEAQARARTPFGFFAHALTAGGRRAFRARLGREADDPLDAFLDLAQDFCRSHPPTLAGFLAWMQAAPAELKRDLDVASGEVRVMTTHGAKGLEAGFVILADTCGPATSGRSSPIIMLPRPEAGHDAAPIPIWAGSKADDPPAVAEARATVLASAHAEHRRLLYVAMTRARDRLLVCGHDIGKSRPEGAWYDLVRDGLKAHPAITEIAVEGEEQPMLALRSGAAAVAEPREQAAPPLALPAPAWLAAQAGFEAAPGPPLSPSALVAEDAENAISSGGPMAEAARARGVLLHRLLKALPDVPPERRLAVADRIAADGLAGDEGARVEIAASALAIVADPAFAEIFASTGRSEVPIVGRLADGRPVSGRIDRLAVTENEVLVVDYKTDRSPPPPGAPIPERYAAQIKAYAELLADIWPGRPVRAAILWTATPRLQPLALRGAPLA